eukprot:5735838-Pleurochrysis_carterae.AAC.1
MTDFGRSRPDSSHRCATALAVLMEWVERPQAPLSIRTFSNRSAQAAALAVRYFVLCTARLAENSAARHAARSAARSALCCAARFAVHFAACSAVRCAARSAAHFAVRSPVRCAVRSD